MYLVHFQIFEMIAVLNGIVWVFDIHFDLCLIKFPQQIFSPSKPLIRFNLIFLPTIRFKYLSLFQRHGVVIISAILASTYIDAVPWLSTIAPWFIIISLNPILLQVNQLI